MPPSGPEPRLPRDSYFVPPWILSLQELLRLLKMDLWGLPQSKVQLSLVNHIDNRHHEQVTCCMPAHHQPGDMSRVAVSV